MAWTCQEVSQFLLLAAGIIGVFTYIFVGADVLPASAEKPKKPPQPRAVSSLCSVVDDDCPRLFGGNFNYQNNTYSTARNYNLATCNIPNSLTASLAASICYLSDPVAFVAANRSIKNDSYESRFCRDKFEFETLNDLSKVISNATKLVVVQDPIDRFLASFLKKCDAEGDEKSCHSCKRDLRCFLEAQYKMLTEISRDEYTNETMGDEDFLPQHWFCEFNTSIYDYHIIKYGADGKQRERMTQQIGVYLIQQGAPRWQERYVSNGLMASKPAISRRQSKYRGVLRKQLMEDQSLLKLFLKMYYYDYNLFGFNMPPLTGK